MKIQNNIGIMSGHEVLKANQGQEAEQSFELLLEKAQLEKDDETLKEACREMEAYFIQYLFKTMKSSTQLGDGIIPKGEHEEIFEDMLIEEQSKEATKAGGIGLSDMLYKQLSKEYAAAQYQQMSQQYAAQQNQGVGQDVSNQNILNPGITNQDNEIRQYTANQTQGVGSITPGTIIDSNK